MNTQTRIEKFTPSHYVSFKQIEIKYGKRLNTWLHQKVGKETINQIQEKETSIYPLSTKGRGTGIWAEPVIVEAFETWCKERVEIDKQRADRRETGELSKKREITAAITDDYGLLRDEWNGIVGKPESWLVSKAYKLAFKEFKRSNPVVKHPLINCRKAGKEWGLFIHKDFACYYQAWVKSLLISKIERNLAK